MATAAEIERLRALLDRLSPLATARRGGPIRASDWNLLVSAVAELARAVLGADDGDAEVERHDHVGQVQLTWLAPEIRRLLDRVGRPQDAWSVADLRRGLDRQEARLEAIDQEIRRARDLATHVRAQDAVRESEINRLRTVVDGVRDERVDLARLRAGLEALRADVARVAEVGAGLEVDGEPVDLAGVARRVADLEALRERLTRPDGTLLDAALFEARLAELTAELVTEERLEEALDARAAGVADEVVAGIEARVGESVRTRLQGELAGLAESLRATMDERLADVDARIDRRLEAERPALIAGAADELRERIDEATRAAADAVRRATLAEVEAAEARLRGLVQERVAALEQRLPDLVGGAVAERIEGATAGLSRTLDALRQRLQREAERLDGLAGDVAAIRRDVAAGFRAAGEAREGMRSALLAEVEAGRARLDEATDRRFERLERSIERRLDEREAVLRESLTRRLTVAASNAVRAESRRLRADLTEMVRNLVPRRPDDDGGP